MWLVLNSSCYFILLEDFWCPREHNLRIYVQELNCDTFWNRVRAAVIIELCHLSAWERSPKTAGIQHSQMLIWSVMWSQCWYVVCKCHYHSQPWWTMTSSNHIQNGKFVHYYLPYDGQCEQLVAFTSVTFAVVQAMILICGHHDPSGCDAFEGFSHVSQPAWILRSARDFDQMN